MTIEEKKEIAEVIALSVNTNSTQGNKLVDIILKIATAISTAGILWLGSTMITVNERIIKMEIQQDYANEQIREIKTFTEKPRFTEEDDNIKLSPIIRKLAEQELTNSRAQDWMNEQESLFVRFELQLQQIQNDIRALEE